MFEIYQGNFQSNERHSEQCQSKVIMMNSADGSYNEVQNSFLSALTIYMSQ